MKLIINAAMIPNEGLYAYLIIDRNAATAWLNSFAASAISYVGYEQTRSHLLSLMIDRPVGGIPLNRAKCSMAPGDEALVCRLAYRLDNPATKGSPQPEDWEYGILECLCADAFEDALDAARLAKHA